MHAKHQVGQVSEARVALHLSQRGWWVFAPIFAVAGPIDLIAVHPRVYIALIDVKTETKRSLANRPGKYRISRVLSPLQKRLQVFFAYASSDDIKFVGCSDEMNELLH